MKDHQELIQSIENRIRKRFKHLAKWAKGQGVLFSSL